MEINTLNRFVISMQIWHSALTAYMVLVDSSSDCNLIHRFMLMSLVKFVLYPIVKNVLFKNKYITF